MTTHPTGREPLDADAVDLTAVRADDDLIDQIAAGLDPDNADAVTALLVAWRDAWRAAPGGHTPRPACSPTPLRLIVPADEPVEPYMTVADLTTLIAPPTPGRTRVVLKPRGPQRPPVAPEWVALLNSPAPSVDEQPVDAAVSAAAALVGVLILIVVIALVVIL